jgi:hypothetical protein
MNKKVQTYAIVSGVTTHEDMLEKDVKAVSAKAFSLGASVGMKGREVLELFRLVSNSGTDLGNHFTNLSLRFNPLG